MGESRVRCGQWLEKCVAVLQHETGVERVCIAAGRTTVPTKGCFGLKAHPFEINVFEILHTSLFMNF